MLGRTKDQIRTTEQVNAALTACKNLNLDGLVIIGGEYALGLAHVLTLYLLFYFIKHEIGAFQGVTSNTDAAYLAETFAEAKCPTKVVLGLVCFFFPFEIIGSSVLLELVGFFNASIAVMHLPICISLAKYDFLSYIDMLMN